jgi:hypothetical protein
MIMTDFLNTFIVVPQKVEQSQQQKYMESPQQVER